MSDSEYFFVVPTLVTQAFVIILSYYAIGAISFVRPAFILMVGLGFMALAGLSKAALLPLANAGHVVFSSIPTAITIIEVSTASVGGSLVAASFILKAQILHNKWKREAEEDITDLKERLIYIREGITELKNTRETMPQEEFDERLDTLRSRETDRRRKLERLEEEYKHRHII